MKICFIKTMGEKTKHLGIIASLTLKVYLITYKASQEKTSDIHSSLERTL